ncbi:hypothetical protein BB558_007371 [Smittium angustum]|uniref:DNA repair and recombination protein RAD26 n=1 Tax=Smittium angustum TaxID=133377 RepID=A0A2U1IV79_SMIAN|nr:hypothetical protein BB558_007371 [Smittium angustum]
MNNQFEENDKTKKDRENEELELLGQLGGNLNIVAQKDLEFHLLNQIKERELLEKSKIDSEKKNTKKLDISNSNYSSSLSEIDIENFSSENLSSEESDHFHEKSKQEPLLESSTSTVSDKQKNSPNLSKNISTTTIIKSSPSTSDIGNNKIINTDTENQTDKLVNYIVPQRKTALKSINKTKEFAQKIKKKNKFENSDDNSYSENIQSSSDTSISGSDVDTTSEELPKTKKKNSFSKKIKDDDGYDFSYMKRLDSWRLQRYKARYGKDPESYSDPELEKEEYLPDPNHDDHPIIVSKEVEEIIKEQEVFSRNPRKNNFSRNSKSSLVSLIEYDNDVLMVPNSIWEKLLDYQRTGLEWLWKLHNLKCGGILGDEMGLGKTIQIVSFLGSLYHSKALKKKTERLATSSNVKIENNSNTDTTNDLDATANKSIKEKQLPSLIVCPATLMRQWMDEFHKWWSPLKVVLLHSTGSGIRLYKDTGYESQLSEDDEYEAIDDEGFDSEEYWEHDIYGWRTRKTKSYSSMRKLNKKLIKVSKKQSNKRTSMIIDQAAKNGSILITTYAGLASNKGSLLDVNWAYVILDEGHTIKNPLTEASIMAKRLKTCHRILVSGTPIQNNLHELWTLVDFVYPGLLGSQQQFSKQFEEPITTAMANKKNRLKNHYVSKVSDSNLETVYQCMVDLRKIIAPYLLRREKQFVLDFTKDVTELVLVCNLTLVQHKIYERFVNGKYLQRILEGKLHVLFGIDYVRKIANHPNLLKVPGTEDTDECCELVKKSGKLTVLHSLLEMWHKKGDKVLLFAQTRQMLDIIERSINHTDSCPKKQTHSYKYMRMDGTTPVQSRSGLVNIFNSEDTKEGGYFLFLLTTRVGGLGLNLASANRVIIFDPDWNPSTDNQAKQRVVRIGQNRHVYIYRLITNNTIETNIYYKQLYKQLLSLNVLKNPSLFLKNKYSFFSQSVHDLFKFNSSFDNKNSSLIDPIPDSIENPTNTEENLSSIDSIFSVEPYTLPKNLPTKTKKSRIIKPKKNKGEKDKNHHNENVFGISPEGDIEDQDNHKEEYEIPTENLDDLDHTLFENQTISQCDNTKSPTSENIDTQNNSAQDLPENVQSEEEKEDKLLKDLLSIVNVDRTLHHESLLGPDGDDSNKDIFSNEISDTQEYNENRFRKPYQRGSTSRNEDEDYNEGTKSTRNKKAYSARNSGDKSKKVYSAENDYTDQGIYFKLGKKRNVMDTKNEKTNKDEHDPNEDFFSNPTKLLYSNQNDIKTGLKSKHDENFKNNSSKSILESLKQIKSRSTTNTTLSKHTVENGDDSDDNFNTELPKDIINKAIEKSENRVGFNIINVPSNPKSVRSTIQKTYYRGLSEVPDPLEKRPYSATFDYNFEYDTNTPKKSGKKAKFQSSTILINRTKNTSDSDEKKISDSTVRQYKQFVNIEAKE